MFNSMVDKWRITSLKDVYLTLTGLGYEFNINVPWYWTNWFLIVMTRMWCWLDWPRPTGDVSGCGRPRGHHSPIMGWAHTRPAIASRDQREEPGGISRKTLHPHPGWWTVHRQNCVSNAENHSIALNLFCNQGIKWSSWGSVAAAVYSLWP